MANHLTEGAWQWPDHLNLLSLKLADVGAGRCKRLIVTMPPQNGKSLTASHWFPVWFLNLFPDRRLVFTSYGAEYAESWGRRVRNSIDEHAKSLRVRLAIDNGAAGEWETTQGGGQVSVGIGGSVNGRRADGFLVDDPFKNAEEANSQNQRDKVWDFFLSCAYTRLTPDGFIIIIMCMVGDTRVLMADGTEKYLKDIHCGDVIASYHQGKLSSSTVRNWANQGTDQVYEVRMKSGITVKANERHPFLVWSDREKPEWVRLRNLKVGDKILRVNGIGESGVGSCAPVKGATSPQNARDFACTTTVKQDGPADIDRHPLTLSRGERRECDIDTKSIPSTSKTFSVPNKEGVRSVESFQQQTSVVTGVENSALTTTTKQEKSEACSATTAISCSDTARRKEFSSRPLSTYEIVPDSIIEIVDAGHEEVFDIQVDDTENFIANGLVSHNTRWNEDDLVGRIDKMEAEGGEKWERLNLPAIAEENDQMGRHPGEALWPARWNLEHLHRIKRMIGTYFWNALYQQRPSPVEGTYFKRHWFEVVEPNRVPRITTQARSWDLAATAEGENGNSDPDWLSGCKMGVDAQGVYYIFNVKRDRLSPDGVGKTIKQTAGIDGRGVVIRIEQEGAASGKIVKHHYTQMMDGYDCRFVTVPKSSKLTRSGPFNAACERGDVKLVAGPWIDEFLEELAAFPNGKHDDQVDSAVGAYEELVAANPPMDSDDWQRIVSYDRPMGIAARDAFLRAGLR